MTPEEHSLIKQIWNVVKCPIDWEMITNGEAPGLVTELNWFWKNVTKNYEVDNECRHVYVLYYDPLDDECSLDYDIDIENPDADGDDPDVLRSELKNIIGGPLESGWVKAARDEYEAKVGALSRLKVADDSVQSKHFLPANVPLEERLKRSKTGASILHPEIEPKLQEIMWSCLDDYYWKRIALEGAKYLYVEYPWAVGVSRGVETKFLKFDFDLSTPVVHAYPIPKSEIPEGELAVFYDY